MIKNFLFQIPPRENRIPYFDRIQLISLYLTAIALILTSIYNTYILYADGFYFFSLMGIVLIILTMSSLFIFWKTRNIVYSQRLIAFVIFLVMTLIIWNGGGRFGLASLYFLATFSIFFLILDYTTGIILPVYYLFGFSLRLLLGRFGSESIFFQSELRYRFAVVLAIACLFGIVGSVSINMLVKYLSTLAYTDPVTGLPNMKRFRDIFRGMTELKDLKHEEGLTLVGFKVLHFDLINANYGPEKGNAILRETGRRLEQCRFKLLSRWNGAIFLAVLPPMKLDELKLCLRNTIEILRAPSQVDECSIVMQFIAAVSRYPDDAVNAPDIQKHVLTQLEDKRLIHGDILFYNEEKMKLEQQRFSLREALAKAVLDQEFSLVYQPKIRLADNRCVGAEILLRWNRSDFGPVSPEDFIPLAEENGMIRTISRWVIGKAFREIAAADRKDLVFAINLSVIDLKDPEFIPYVREARRKSAVLPSRIEFEVTESVQADQDPQIQDTLRTLLSEGYKLSIDDFGTGYSSLSYLHKLKVNNLKIDRSFVQMIGPSENSRYPVIDAIISMGLSMGLEITAEGVETESQAAYLMKRKCKYAQGWLYSKGVGWNDFTGYLKKRND